MAHHSTSPLTLLFIFILMASGAKMYARAKNITIVNVCKETVWPGVITQNNSYQGDGFTLKPGQSASYDAPSGWSGRIWARTGCDFNNSTSTCQTGSCGPSINCTGPGSLPATIAEFTLGGDADFYDVSLVDGFNVPILVRPLGGKGNCSTAGCDGDLRQSCPSELTVKANGKVIGCRSACDTFNRDQFCCRGSYGDQATCLPSNYSSSFKQVCPAASTMIISFSVINRRPRNHSLKAGGSSWCSHCHLSFLDLENIKSPFLPFLSWPHVKQLHYHAFRSAYDGLDAIVCSKLKYTNPILLTSNLAHLT